MDERERMYIRRYCQNLRRHQKEDNTRLLLETTQPISDDRHTLTTLRIPLALFVNANIYFNSMSSSTRATSAFDVNLDQVSDEKGLEMHDFI